MYFVCLLSTAAHTWQSSLSHASEMTLWSLFKVSLQSLTTHDDRTLLCAIAVRLSIKRISLVDVLFIIHSAQLDTTLWSAIMLWNDQSRCEMDKLNCEDG